MAFNNHFRPAHGSILVLLTAVLILSLNPIQAANHRPALATKAFPGAQGFGAVTPGGRAGRVIEVTTLDDSGPGSLREAIDASGPRIVVFKVGGTITLNTPIDIRSSYLTIAGQTAPGDGITLRSLENRGDMIFALRDNVQDVIIRYLRLRSGKGKPGVSDVITFYSANNILLDHLSIAWGNDENIGMSVIQEDNYILNITVQHSIIAEALRPHSTGILIAGYETFGEHVQNISLHHNLFAHNAHRNPRVDAAKTIVFTNNVVYNWFSRAGEVLRPATVDYVSNYFKAGPWSKVDEVLFYEEISSPPSIYIEGNIAEPQQPDASTDNWDLIKYSTLNRTSDKVYLPTEWRRLTPLPSGGVSIQPAADAYQLVLADAGANARLECNGTWTKRLDRVDQNIIEDVINGTGPAQESEIDHQDDFGGYPDVQGGTPCTDTDHDGMPDEYEIAKGFNPNDAADGSQDADSDSYTNVEEYLNGT